MPLLIWAMMTMGSVTLAGGLVRLGVRFRSPSTIDKFLALGPVLEATALAIFAAEHFFAARNLMAIVPRWLPWPLFWTYFVGAALLAAAISLVIWWQVRWSAILLALLFLLIVVTIDLPNIPKHLQERLFWTLTFRETAFAGGAMALAGSMWPSTKFGTALTRIGSVLVAGTFIFYAVEHFLFPRFVPGVPLEKLTPAWVPLPVVLAYFVGLTLLASGVGLLFRRTIRIAAATAGAVLVLLTAFFYLPIFAMEIHSPLALEGLNYVGDTLLFAATALLSGFGAD